MNTSGLPFTPSIEILESRIAPAAITFTDFDGDLVKITISNGSAAEITAAAHIAGGQLQELDLASNPIFDGANVAIEVAGGAGNGIAEVGFLNATGRDLGVVKIVGDLGRIKVGDAITTDGSVTQLSVATMGARGTVTQAAGGDLQSAFAGKLGALISTGSLTRVSILVSGGVFDLDGQIGSIEIGGDLIGGGGERSGTIYAKGAIGTAHIAGDLTGGTGTESGSIITERKLDSITVDGQLLGKGLRSARIFAADVLGFARVTGKIQGGDGDDSGSIASFTALGTVVLKDQLIGGGGLHSGAIGSGGDIDAVSVSGLIQGGAGKRSGGIFAKGDIGSVKTVGITGGAAKLSGVIAAGGVIQFAKINGDLTGGAGFESGAVGSDAGIGKIVVTGSVIGAAGKKSGAILSAGGIHTVVVGGSLLGGSGNGSGIIGATGLLDTISIVGSLIGGGGIQSGAIGSTLAIHSVSIGGSLEGFARDKVVRGERSAVILSGGNIDLVHIAGSIVGGDATKSGAIVSYGAIGLVTVDHDIIGGAGIDSGSVSGENVVTETGVTGGAIRKVVVHGLIQGGAGENSGTVQSSEDIGKVIVDGNMTGGSGDFSGSIVSGGRLGKARIGGSVTGGGGQQSGVIETDGELRAGNMGIVEITGDLTGGSGPNSGTIFSSGKLASVTVGRVIAGKGFFSGGIGSALDAGVIVINGVLQAGVADEAGKISIGGDLDTLIIHGDVSGGAGRFDTAGIGGEELGQISVFGTLTTLTIDGSLNGGAGALSAQVRAGSIKTVSIGGSINGGAGDGSGALVAANKDLGSISITGSLNGGSGLRAGLIAAERNIGAINVGTINDLSRGANPGRATISAGGVLNPATDALAVAIGEINVAGRVTAADILAGYDIDGTPVNPDAQIFAVKIGTSATLGTDIFDRTNIVAGMTAGADRIFGSGDEVVIPSSASSVTIISKIASVVLNGLIVTTPRSGTFGIEAQEITAMTINGTPVSLKAGPDNDAISAINKSNLSIFEAGALNG